MSQAQAKDSKFPMPVLRANARPQVEPGHSQRRAQAISR